MQGSAAERELGGGWRKICAPSGSLEGYGSIPYSDLHERVTRRLNVMWLHAWCYSSWSQVVFEWVEVYQAFKQYWLFLKIRPVWLVWHGSRHHLFITAAVVLPQHQGLNVYTLRRLRLQSWAWKVTSLQWLLCGGPTLLRLCELRGGGHPLQA